MSTALKQRREGLARIEQLKAEAANLTEDAERSIAEYQKLRLKRESELCEVRRELAGLAHLKATKTEQEATIQRLEDRLRMVNLNSADHIAQSKRHMKLERDAVALDPDIGYDLLVEMSQQISSRCENGQSETDRLANRLVELLSRVQNLKTQKDTLLRKITVMSGTQDSLHYNSVVEFASSSETQI
ncbi:hypothetical protein SprV_0602138400 [Sparganum proliferum]